MAEVFAITAGVGSVLKAIGSTGVYLNSAAGASREVQDIAKNMCATEKILKSLEASIETFPQSDYFYDIWSDSAKSVIEDVKTTIEELNSKLPQPRINGRLSTFERVKWPLAREETVLLLEHLKAYIQMLTMVQNALVQGSMLAVHNTAKGIEEISTRVGTLPSSRVQRALVVAPNNLQMAILPEESASQIAIMTPDQPSEPVAEAVMSSCPRVSSDQPVEIVRSQERTNNTVSVVEPRLIMECVDTYEFTMNLVEIRFQDYKRRDGKYDRLGKGKLLLTLSQDHARVFVKYKELHVPSPNKRNVWEGYFELHSYRIDVLVEQFARLVWFNSNEIQGISFKNEVTVELHFANGRADKLLFMNGFNKLLRDAAEYARYVNVRKAEAIALRQQRPQLPYLHQLDQFHQLHQQPIAHQQTHRDNDCQYAHLSNRQEYFQRMVTEEHLQPSTSLQYAQASNISNTVPNMSYEQYLAQNSTRNVIEQRSDRQNMHKPDPAQHSQHHLVKTSPFYYKLVKLGRSSGSEQPCTPEHLIESNSTEDFAATSITTDAEPQPPAKQPTELHRERVQTQPKISVEVISSRNVALDVLLSHFFMKLIFPLIALLATCQELRVYLRCISDVISEQLERGLE